MVMIVVVHALFMGVMVIEVDVRCHMRMISCGNDDSPYEHGNVSEGNHFACFVCATRNVYRYLEVNFESLNDRISPIGSGLLWLLPRQQSN